MLVTMSEIDGSDLDVTVQLPTGTVTLLLADVEGSTRLWQTAPDQMTAVIAALDRTLAELVGSHHGVRPVEQGEGDSFVIAFARASDAVACALALQRAPLAPLRMRMGLHTGEVQLRDEGNYVGPVINLAGRLRSLAHGGQTVLSATTSDLVIDCLPPDAWLTELGALQLRDIARPERVTQLCHPDIRNDFPSMFPTEGVDAHNLPINLTSFVGRAGQIDELRGLLRENRLVTLTGAGGAGKTRLASEIAARSAAEFSDGAWFVDLAPVTDPERVSEVVARMLGLPDQPGRPTMDALVGFLRGRRMLVVLDNCEHLLDACAAVVTAVLGACPAVQLLTTSREPIRAAGEIAWPVPSLALADEALELFADRARQVRPDFHLGDDAAASVVEICQRLDGMPLAIELAAARARALSLKEIRDSLHDRFRLLTGGARTAVRRQQTLRASVDWSHTLLSAAERQLFRRLAVFVGGFDLDAAHAVGGGCEVHRYEVLDQLGLLVDKSLVVAETSDGETRYRLLETVRQYASEKLSESGEAGEVRGRHRDFYTALAARLDEPVAAGHQADRATVEAEFDNVRAAFAWSRENADVTQAMRLVSALQPLWLTGGSGSGPWGRAGEGLSWFAAVFDESVTPIAPAVQARALADWAVLDAAVGAATAIDQAHQALAIARSLDDPALLARALFACGSVAIDDPGAARSYFAEALALARETGDAWMACNILGWRAYTAYIDGELVEACAAAEEGQTLADRIGDEFVSRHCRWSLSLAELLKGDLAAGLARLDALIADADAAHDMLRWANSQLSLGFGLMYTGDWIAARSAVEEMRKLAAELGPVHQALAESGIAATSLAAGDIDEAAVADGAARLLLAGLPVTAAVAIASPAAEICFARGDVVAARQLADAAVIRAPGCFRTRELTTRARVAIAQGDLGLADRDLHTALGFAARGGTIMDVPNTLECLAYLTHLRGSHRDATRLFGAAAAIRQRTGVVRFKVHQDDYDGSVLAVREALNDNEFDTAWAEGAALSTDEAIGYAQRGHGERKRPSSGWASLTPAELDVVRLVREGLGNKDIATRLFVSPRTVQTHLTHIYSKVGVTSRMQLAQEAARHD